MNNKKWTLIGIAVLLLVSLVGCATGKTAPAADGETTPLTPEAIQNIALEHCGLSANQVTDLRTQYDPDDGTPAYDVEFRQGDYEFDYTIHAETGKVLEWDKEYDPVNTPETTKPTEATPQPETTAPTQPIEPAPEKLTKAQAKAIALEHAGLAADEVTFDRTEYEVDDGRPEYEIEFRSGNTEYDYTIHAETGKVLEWDKEYAPVNTPEATKPTETTPQPETTAPTQPIEPAPEKLTKAEAIAAALNHAKLSESDVKRLEAEYDVDDGVPVYSIEFYADGWEYDYEIHAETGKILEWDKDRDD